MSYKLTQAILNTVYSKFTITIFRKRFNNHKSSMRKYEQGGRKMAAKHLYAHFAHYLPMTMYVWFVNVISTIRLLRKKEKKEFLQICTFNI